MAPQDVKVEFDSPHELGKCPGYLNQGNGFFGLIVLSEWWGANEQIREQATEYARNSPYTTLVPDLYRGKIAIDHEEAGHLFSGLNWPGAVQDIGAAVRFLKEQCGCKEVAVTGYCMGGALSLAACATKGPNGEEGMGLAAGVAFYGIPSNDLADLTKLKVPVQCHFGTEDASKGFSAPEDQDKLEEKLKESGVDYEFFRYKGAKHAFCHTGGPNYDAEATKLGFERMLDFLKKHLKLE